MDLPAGLPAPVQRHLEAAGVASSAPIEHVAFSGRGAVRQPVLGGLGVWLPVTWEARLLPALEFVWKARVRLLGLPLLSASDEYRGGRGRLVVGRKVSAGEAFDRAEYAVLWSWTILLAPREALARPDVFCEAVDQTTSRLAFPFRSETWEATLRFDASTGLLARLETHRFNPRSGHPQRWSVEVERYRPNGGRRFPAGVLSRWDGEPAVRLELDRVETGEL